ncbi:MAG: hypothetical protein V4574_18570 [Pseudomonadota bacterium]
MSLAGPVRSPPAAVAWPSREWHHSLRSGMPAGDPFLPAVSAATELAASMPDTALSAMSEADLAPGALHPEPGELAE